MTTSQIIILTSPTGNQFETLIESDGRGIALSRVAEIMDAIMAGETVGADWAIG